MSVNLTARQSRVLDFLRESIASRGYPPTLREIGLHMGIRSTNGVNDHLRALERKGAIARDAMSARGIRILVDDDAPAAPTKEPTSLRLEELRGQRARCASRLQAIDNAIEAEKAMLRTSGRHRAWMAGADPLDEAIDQIVARREARS